MHEKSSQLLVRYYFKSSAPPEQRIKSTRTHSPALLAPGAILEVISSALIICQPLYPTSAPEYVSNGGEFGHVTSHSPTTFLKLCHVGSIYSHTAYKLYSQPQRLCSHPLCTEAVQFGPVFYSFVLRLTQATPPPINLEAAWVCIFLLQIFE